MDDYSLQDGVIIYRRSKPPVMMHGATSACTARRPSPQFLFVAAFGSVISAPSTNQSMASPSRLGLGSYRNKAVKHSLITLLLRTIDAASPYSIFGPTP